MRTWKGKLNKRGTKGRQQRKMKDWLYDFYKVRENDPLNARFSKAEMLAACRMDVNNTKDYHSVASFLTTQIRTFGSVVDNELPAVLRNHPSMDDGTMFKKLVLAAKSYEVYPLKSMGDGIYGLITLDDFREMKQKRMRSVVTEIKNTIPECKKWGIILPQELQGIIPRGLTERTESE